MPINATAPKNVSAGEPITAGAWNVIVDAIKAVVQHLDTSEASSLRVAIKNAGVTGARVAATRDDDVTFEAVPPVPPGTQYIFAGLRAGSYAVRVEAPGFSPATSNVAVPLAAPLEITLTASGAIMPQLFGLTLRAALLELRNRNIAVDRVLDVVGRDVAPASPSSQHNDSAVLLQLPAPGEPVAPEGRSHLVISAALEVQPSIEVPSLAGLTLAEAQKALEGAGLVLGKVTTRQPRPGRPGPPPPGGPAPPSGPVPPVPAVRTGPPPPRPAAAPEPAPPGGTPARPAASPRAKRRAPGRKR